LRDEVGEIRRFEEFAVVRGAILAALFPSIQVAQFHAQDGGLQGVETAVGARNLVEVFGFATVHAEHAKTFGS